MSRRRRFAHCRRERRPSIEPDNDPGSLVSLAVTYPDQLRARHYSETTLDAKGRYLRYFAAWCGDRGIRRPAEVTLPLVERYQRWLFHYRKPKTGEPLSVHSQRSYLAAIRPFFKWLVQQRFLLANPASELVIPRRIKHLPRDILTAEEAERVLGMPDLADPLGVRDRVILETFYATAIRRVELVRLLLQDLDLGRGAAIIQEGKGGKQRAVPLGERCQAWIEKYLREVRPRLAVEPDGGTLFLNNLGEPFSLNGMTQLVRDYVVSSEVGKKGACHLFRHTAATLMLEGGANVRYIQELLGHADLETTEIYTHVTIDKLQAVHRLTHPGAQLRRRGGGDGAGDVAAEVNVDELLLEDVYRTLASEDDDG